MMLGVNGNRYVISFDSVKFTNSIGVVKIHLITL